MLIPVALLAALGPTQSRAAELSAEAAIAAPVVAAPVSTRALAEGFELDVSTTYTLDPPGQAVHVALDITITNQKPDQVAGSYIRQFYLPDFSVPVLSEAVALSAVKSDGTPLPVSVESTESPRFSFAVIDLRPDLHHPNSQTFRFTYDIPPQAPRSDAFTRLNDAYATFPVLAIGDPGITDVEVVVPEGFDVELVGDAMTRSERDGKQVFTATSISNPGSWGVLLSARDDDKLIERTVELGEDDVNVLGWPGDEEWADFVAAQVEEGVPLLEDLTGLDWPADADIDVVETASPYLYGYAGWYVRNKRLIEIGDELDQLVILHELSHLWFNEKLFRGRWINEAFANELASLAAAEMGDDPPKPEPIKGDDPGRLLLNDWSDPDLQAGVSQDQERYGYNTSWSVLDAIVDEIGPERLVAVIQAADAGHIAYRGHDEPEELTRIFDWQELLDLFEEVGGSTKAGDLFRRYVVSASDAHDFRVRSIARRHYGELVTAGEGWAPPESVRLAMTNWKFDVAETLIEDANAVLDIKADLLEVVENLEVSDELALQRSYEDATDIPELAAEADDALGAARELRAATEAEADGAGPVGALGLLFSGVDDDLAAGRDAFDAGDYGAARTAAYDVSSAVDGAAMAGVRRLLMVLVVSLLGWTGVRRLRRRRVRRAAARAAAAKPEPLEELEADGAEGVGGPTDGGGEVGV